MKIIFLKVFALLLVSCTLPFSSVMYAQAAPSESETFAVQTYARQLSSQLAGRPLSEAERKLIATEGEAALPALIKSWVDDPFFSKAFRARVEILIGTSGERDSVDFNLPGNLAQYIVSQKLPMGELLTADYCVDAKGAKITCDTGAPFAAGVIGTRGYLLAHAGRFNLGRANAMMSAFACTHYPMSESLQPRIPKADLIPNFRISSAEEAKEAGSTGFGNGAACYTCHGQFSAHTQFFVKFDDKGLYKADASGLQSQKLEFGRADNDLYASHFIDPKKSADESSDMFGTKASNLSEAMKAMSSNPAFLQCMVKQVVAHVFNLDSEVSNKINDKFMEIVAESLSKDEATVQNVYQKVLTHNEMIKAFARGVVAP
ncbi:MAG: hypothetical protein EOP10_17920 [Proteobacteria bacterium]|nr:MAG: hypothetical protein EOP10_17920 [Pseudomonadota bacterium]